MHLWSGNSSGAMLSGQANYDEAKTNCIRHCNMVKVEVERVYVGIRRVFINDYECKCFSRDSGEIIGRPKPPKTDARYYIECARLSVEGISFYDSDASLKRFLTVSKKTLRTTEGQWEGSVANICNATQVTVEDETSTKSTKISTNSGD